MPADPRLLLITLALLSTLHSHVSAKDGEPPQIYLHTDHFLYSAPVSVDAFTSDWHGPYQGGEWAVALNEVEMGIHYQEWQLGYLYRHQAEARFSADSARLVYLTRNHLPLPTGEELALDLKVQQVITRGLRLGRRWQWEHLGLTPSLLLWQAERITDGALSGHASVVGDKDYDYQVAVDYHYTEDGLFGRENPAPTGTGYSLELSGSWQPVERLDLSWQLRNLYGFIDWPEAPRTRAEVTSATKHYDSDGYVVYSPSMSGWEGYDALHQRLRPSAQVVAEWHGADGVRLRGEALLFQQGGVAMLEYARPVGSVEIGLQAALAPVVGYGLGVRWRGVQARLLSDKPTDLHAARLIALSAGVVLRW